MGRDWAVDVRRGEDSFVDLRRLLARTWLWITNVSWNAVERYKTNTASEEPSVSESDSILNLSKVGSGDGLLSDVCGCWPSRSTCI